MSIWNLFPNAHTRGWVSARWVRLGLRLLLFLALSFGVSQMASASPADLYEVAVTITSAVPNPVTVGQATSISVKVNAPGAPETPGGVVEVKSGQQLFCQIALDPAGEGSCSLTFPTSGVIPLKAVYPGGTYFLPGVSAVLDLEVMDLNGDVLYYRQDFETLPGSEWCLQRQDVTPSGRGFLGQFGNETTCLHFTNLPSHSWLKLSFDLYLIRSWNGNVELYGSDAPDTSTIPEIKFLGPNYVVGPDHFQLLFEGHNLLNTTFSNYPDFTQAYPGSYPGGDYSPQTGATQINTLGFIHYDDPMDSVYHLTFIFQHSSPQIQLEFSAWGLQELANESWGLDNLQVVYNRLGVHSIYLPILALDAGGGS